MNESKNFYFRNQKYIVPVAIVGLYAYIYATLKNGNEYIARQDTWSSWQSNDSLDQLKRTNQTELANSLLLEIQKKHINTKFPIDFLSPFASFMNAIDQEARRLTFYFKFYNFLKKTKLIFLFPLDTKNFLKIASKLERLNFIVDKFITWLSQYKIEKNKDKNIKSAKLV